MATRRVVVQLVVAFGVTLPMCTHSQGFTNPPPPPDLSDYPFTDGVNSTADSIVDGNAVNASDASNATDSPDIIQQEFGPRAITEGPVGSTVQTPITQTTVQASDGTLNC